jgi:hypothetical protein
MEQGCPSRAATGGLIDSSLLVTSFVHMLPGGALGAFVGYFAKTKLTPPISRTQLMWVAGAAAFVGALITSVFGLLLTSGG